MSERAPAPWEQQPEETPRAYGAFCVYRDLGPRRTLAAAAAAFFERTGDAPERQVDKWSSAHRWVERAAAWDRHLDAEGRAAQETARREMRRRLRPAGGGRPGRSGRQHPDPVAEVHSASGGKFHATDDQPRQWDHPHLCYPG